MKYLSVCSGIEAATSAWHGLGWEPFAFSEIEPFPSAVLAHHYPNVPNLGDMTKFQEWPDAAIDLLVGGTPCQSFSVAGLRKGLADPRGNLMLTYGAIAAKYRPTWLVWENVPGVLSSNRGKDFGTFLGMLAELGYGFAYRVLDAQYFGVAQRRRRVFVVGYLGDWRRAAAVLFERQSLSGNPAPRRSKGEGFTHDVAQCLTTKGHHMHDTRGQDPVVATFTLQHAQIGRKDSAGPQGKGWQQDVAFTLDSRPCADAVVLPINDMATRFAGTDGSGNHAGKGHGLGIGGPDDPMFTLTKGDKHAVLSRMDVRRLMPVECERLQGFADGYTDVARRGKPAADGPRYEALGNTMAVPVMEWIGGRIQQVSELIAQQEAA